MGNKLYKKLNKKRKATSRVASNSPEHSEVVRRLSGGSTGNAWRSSGAEGQGVSETAPHRPSIGELHGDGDLHAGAFQKEDHEDASPPGQVRGVPLPGLPRPKTGTAGSTAWSDNDPKPTRRPSFGTDLAKRPTAAHVPALTSLSALLRGPQVVSDERRDGNWQIRHRRTSKVLRKNIMYSSSATDSMCLLCSLCNEDHV